MSRKSQNFIQLLPSVSLPSEMKILSALVKIFFKTEMKLFPQCAISQFSRSALFHNFPAVRYFTPKVDFDSLKYFVK